jgi:arylsulfatase A-like enzyme
MTSLRSAGLFSLVGCLALTLGGCGGADSEATLGPPSRVFLIVVDTLRADHLGAYGYPRATSPFLDPLANQGVVFDRAIAQWPKTGSSMASMFTGRYPQTTGLTHKAAIRLPEEYETLPELFHDNGYTTLAVIGNAVLSSELGWNQGFDEFVEPWKLAEVRPKTPLQWRKVLNANRITAAGSRLLEAHAQDPKLFVWMHYLDPHAPYVLPKGVENPFLEDEHYSGERKIGTWFPRQEILEGRQELDYYIAQYDANVLVVDQGIRTFLAEARELGLLENALVVFTSDHGEGLGDHNELKHGRLPYNSSAQVPLFFWYPSAIEGGRRVERPVELLDLYPTLRDLVAPELVVDGLEGSSLIDFLNPAARRADTAAIEPDAFRYAFSSSGSRGWMYYRTIQSRERKLIYHPDRSRWGLPKTFELYDLEADPGETRNLIDERRNEARELRAELFAWMKEPKGIAETDETAEQSKDTLDALKALGYLN